MWLLEAAVTIDAKQCVSYDEEGTQVLTELTGMRMCSDLQLTKIIFCLSKAKLCLMWLS